MTSYTGATQVYLMFSERAPSRMYGSNKNMQQRFSIQDSCVWEAIHKFYKVPADTVVVKWIPLICLQRNLNSIDVFHLLRDLILSPRLGWSCWGWIQWVEFSSVFSGPVQGAFRCAISQLLSHLFLHTVCKCTEMDGARPQGGVASILLSGKRRRPRASRSSF